MTNRNITDSTSPGEEPYLDEVVTTSRLRSIHRPLPLSVACDNKTFHTPPGAPAPQPRLDMPHDTPADKENRQGNGTLYPIDLNKGDERVGPHITLFQRRVYDVKFILTKGQISLRPTCNETFHECQPCKTTGSPKRCTPCSVEGTAENFEEGMAERAILEGQLQLSSLLHENISERDTASSFPSSLTCPTDQRGSQARELIDMFFSLLGQVVVVLECRRSAYTFSLRSQVFSTLGAARGPRDATSSEVEAFEKRRSTTIELVKGLDVSRGLSSEYRTWFDCCEEDCADMARKWGNIEEVNGQLIAVSNKIEKMHSIRLSMETMERQHNSLVLASHGETDGNSDIALPMEDINLGPNADAGNGDINHDSRKRREDQPVSSYLRAVGVSLVGTFLFIGTGACMVFW